MKYCFLIILIIAISCTENNKLDQTWEVYTLGLPDKVAPLISSVNIGLYILMQTHEPYFRVNISNDEVKSRVLKSWKQDQTKNLLELCPKQGVIFPNGQKLDLEFIATHLTDVFKRHEIQFKKITKAEKCLSIYFTNHVKSLFKILSSYNNAPSIKTIHNNIEYGLGDYAVKSVSKDIIILKKLKRSPAFFTEVQFLNYKEGHKISSSKSKAIEDFNRIYVADIPKWVKKEYRSYGITLLQAIVLILNIENNTERSFIYNCFDIDQLNRAFMPGQKEFYQIANILPMGMLGAINSVPNQSCNSKQTRKNVKPLRFWNWKSDNIKEMSNFVTKFNNTHETKLNLVHKTENDLIKYAFNQPHPWHLVIAALGATEPSYKAYVKYLFEKGSLLYDHKIPEKIIETFNRLEDESNSKQLEADLAEIVKFIEINNYVLPLYQEMRKFYYPKDLKNLGLGKTLLEYPEIRTVKR